MKLNLARSHMPARRGVGLRLRFEIWCCTKNLYEKGSRKLQPHFIDPFKAVRVVGDVAVELELPKQCRKVHNVFHVLLLKPYKTADPEHVKTVGASTDPVVRW